MYELVIANKNYSSWSMRPWVLLRALGIGFRERVLPFHRNFGEGDFRRFSPSGRVPCLVDGAACVWDSLAIAEYLAERHEGVWPAEAGPRAWARSAAAEMHSSFGALRSECSMNVGVRVRLYKPSKALLADIERLAALWADGFARHGGPFLAGNAFTAVDAFYAPVATRIQTYGLRLPDAAAQYARRLLDLPPVKQWMAEGVAETWRDAVHEADMLALGEVLEDHRAPPAQHEES